ncbi:hypothetical protein N657DRAFT_645936 [Parathielavia appendiculata]|uniref:Uncharacterized protein n=1 Tax=Parathielavia appendiculata TaxID=2587402 RepID=A0AAN6U0S0_9PEZI|nr:hypothetical protein N657DRAFT_645936 [Parathielavia appendiculata]
MGSHNRFGGPALLQRIRGRSKRPRKLAHDRLCAALLWPLSSTSRSEQTGEAEPQAKDVHGTSELRLAVLR